MFKPLHGFNATITSSVELAEDFIEVDEISACLFSRRIPAGDHTYLVLQQIGGYDFEVVKAIGIVGNVISLVRARDGTPRQNFAAGSKAVFVFAESAIQEIMASASMGEVVLTGGGIVEVTKIGTNEYQIYAPEIELTSDAPDILVSGEFPTYTISAPIKSMCCDDTPVPTPEE